ncbi:MAG TPA: BTAD domain-containing putative transcriptional regulator [Pilimelia sp.]|nr:BTAD domain-containing putative transcriptional regulator [Pilimelia sp.]
MRFGILGPVEVWDGDRRVTVGGPQRRALLAVLLLNANRVVSVDRLVEYLWADHPPRAARKLLQGCVAGLRRTLQPDDGDEAATQPLITRPPGYLLRVRPGELDVDRFEEMAAAAVPSVRHASAAALREASELLCAALSLWRGPPLADLAVEACRAEVAQLEERRLAVLEKRVEVDLRLGRHDRLVGELRALVAAYPLRERPWSQLMVALHRAGRQGDALAAYRELRQTLVDQLGVEPNDTSRRIQHAILSGGDPLECYLGMLGPPVTGPEGGEEREPLDADQPVPRELPADVYGFTGRSDELAQLDKLLTESRQASPVVISAVSGTAGVGKTALAVHWAYLVADRFPDGQLYIDLRGYDPDQPMDSADALARLLRSTGVAGRDIPHGLAERAARYRSLLSGRRMLIVLDNAHGAEQVRPLLPGSGSCLAMVTSRDSLGGLVARDGARRIDLDPLSLTEALALLRTLVGDRVDTEPDASDELARRCARLPLALRVAAQIAAARPARPLADLVAELADERYGLDLLRAGDDDRSAVRTVFWWSYRQLPAGTAQMFRMLGLHPGVDIDAHGAAALAGVDVDSARRLVGALAGASLVQTDAAGRYRMHDLLRAYAAERADESAVDDRRAALGRLLHYYLATAAAAMDLLYPAERHLRPRVVAPSAGGPPLDTEEQARTWLDAERANLGAIVGYAADHDWRAEAGRLAAIIFRYLDQGAHHRDALVIHGHARRAAHDGGDHHGVAIARHNLGATYYDLGRYDEAADHFERACAGFHEAGDRTGETRALSNLGIIQALRGRHDKALGHYRQALGMSREMGDKHGEAILLGWVGLELGRLGRTGEALDHLWQALAAFRRIGQPYREAEVLIDLGQVHLWAGRYDEAVELTEQALAIKRDGSDRYHQIHALNLLAEIHRAAGRPDEALARHRSALALTADSGHPEERARALDGIAHIYHAAGRPESARRHWRDALELYTELQMPEANEVRINLRRLGQQTDAVPSRPTGQVGCAGSGSGDPVRQEEQPGRERDRARGRHGVANRPPSGPSHHHVHEHPAGLCDDADAEQEADGPPGRGAEIRAIQE